MMRIIIVFLLAFTAFTARAQIDLRQIIPDSQQYMIPVTDSFIESEWYQKYLKLADPHLYIVGDSICYTLLDGIDTSCVLASTAVFTDSSYYWVIQVNGGTTDTVRSTELLNYVEGNIIDIVKTGSTITWSANITALLDTIDHNIPDILDSLLVYLPDTACLQSLLVMNDTTFGITHCNSTAIKDTICIVGMLGQIGHTDIRLDTVWRSNDTLFFEMENKEGVPIDTLFVVIPDSDNQTLSWDNGTRTLSISGGNSVVIPTGDTDTDNQTIDVFTFDNGTRTLSLSIQDDGEATKTVVIPTGDTDTDDQTLSYIQNGQFDTIGISEGNEIYLFDQDSQSLSFNTGTRTLTITRGNSVVIPGGVDTYIDSVRHVTVGILDSIWLYRDSLGFLVDSFLIVLNDSVGLGSNQSFTIDTTAATFTLSSDPTASPDLLVLPWKDAIANDYSANYTDSIRHNGEVGINRTPVYPLDIYQDPAKFNDPMVRLSGVWGGMAIRYEDANGADGWYDLGMVSKAFMLQQKDPLISTGRIVVQVDSGVHEQAFRLLGPSMNYGAQFSDYGDGLYTQGVEYLAGWSQAGVMKEITIVALQDSMNAPDYDWIKLENDSSVTFAFDLIPVDSADLHGLIWKDGRIRIGDTLPEKYNFNNNELNTLRISPPIIQVANRLNAFDAYHETSTRMWLRNKKSDFHIRNHDSGTAADSLASYLEIGSIAFQTAPASDTTYRIIHRISSQANTEAFVLYKDSLKLGDYTPDKVDSTITRVEIDAVYVPTLSGVVRLVSLDTLNAALNFAATDDHDWYTIGTTDAPTAMGQNIFTTGKVRIGQDSLEASSVTVLINGGIAPLVTKSSVGTNLFRQESRSDKQAWDHLKQSSAFVFKYVDLDINDSGIYVWYDGGYLEDIPIIHVESDGDLKFNYYPNTRFDGESSDSIKSIYYADQDGLLRMSPIDSLHAALMVSGGDSLGRNVTAGHLVYGSGTKEPGDTTVLRWLNGFLGVGTASPTRSLDVRSPAGVSYNTAYFEANQNTTTFTSTFASIYAANASGTTNSWARINLGDGSNATTAAIGAHLTNPASDYGDLTFWTRNAANGLAERMRISEAGRMTFNNYTGATFDQSPTKILNVDGSGVVGTTTQMGFASWLGTTYTSKWTELANHLYATSTTKQVTIGQTSEVAGGYKLAVVGTFSTSEGSNMGTTSGSQMTVNSVARFNGGILDYDNTAGSNAAQVLAYHNSGGNEVQWKTITGGAGITVTPATDNITLTATDASATNEIQSLGTGIVTATTYPITITAPGTGITLPVFSSLLAGLVPAPNPAGSTRFLKENGRWEVPVAVGGGIYGGSGTIFNGAVATMGASGFTIAINTGNFIVSDDAISKLIIGDATTALRATNGGAVLIGDVSNEWAFSYGSTAQETRMYNPTYGVNSRFTILDVGDVGIYGRSSTNIISGTSEQVGFQLQSDGDVLLGHAGSTTGDQLMINSINGVGVNLSHEDHVGSAFMRFTDLGSIEFTTSSVANGLFFVQAANKIDLSATLNFEITAGDNILIEAGSGDFIQLDAGTTRIDGGTADNLIINGTAVGTSGVGVLAMFPGVAPSTTPAGSPIQLYNIGGELIVRDAGGNTTTLSPHNFSGIGQRSEDLAWAYFSTFGDKYINVDMLKVVRLVEDMSGEKLVHLGKADIVNHRAKEPDRTKFEKEGQVEILMREIEALKERIKKLENE